ncbi:MAG: cyclic pyranopterin monophosphate synthase MoaC [Alphaproteobacteria bacterium]
MSELTHLDAAGNARMVDVGDKEESDRTATAMAAIRMAPQTLAEIEAGGFKKGDVLAIAQLAGIMAAKRTGDLIPLCHPLGLDKVDVRLTLEPEASRVRIEATCRLRARTGVEMEALTAASVAALTIYDMCKAIDRFMVIEEVRLLHKAGGRSGTWSTEVTR